MARPRTYRTEGIVLRQLPLGEADRVLTLFTPSRGKLRTVARGVRRTKSKLAGHTEQLTYVRVSVAVGKSIDVVSEAETVRSFRGVREDLGRLSQGLYLAELVDGFTVEQSPSAPIFHLLLDALKALEDGARGEVLLRYFETALLARSGFGPELQRCVECRRVLEPGDHLFSSGRGGALCPTCRSTSRDGLIHVSINAMKLLRFFQREPLPKAVALDPPEGILNETERLLRAYVRYVLERETRSTEFMRLVASIGG